MNGKKTAPALKFAFYHIACARFEVKRPAGRRIRGMSWVISKRFNGFPVRNPSALL